MKHAQLTPQTLSMVRWYLFESTPGKFWNDRISIEERFQMFCEMSEDEVVKADEVIDVLVSELFKQHGAGDYQVEGITGYNFSFDEDGCCAIAMLEDDDQ